MKKDKFYKGLSFLTLSSKYLHLVKNVANENIKKGNPHMIFTKKILKNEEYDEMTKWSDYHISIPILFNFYHGLELLLKGFLILKENHTLKTDHHIERLFKEFKSSHDKELKIISILDKYFIIDLMPDFLANCMRNNNIQINNFYEFLRYPADKNFQNIYNYIDLKYKEREGLLFFLPRECDLDILLKEVVKLYREIDKIKVFN